MDDIDRKILKLLQDNARISLKTMAENTFLSSPAVSARIEKLEKDGVIAGYHAQVDEILSYINTHISENLTLEELSAHFFLSSSYLCRIFKATTGTTINKYITAKRITISKSLLSQGYSVNEACEACGFNDYSNYLKAFTKAVGISPKKYAQFNS